MLNRSISSNSIQQSTLLSSIWSIDWTLSGATTQGQSGPESDGMKWYSTFPKTPVLLERHHQIV